MNCIEGETRIVRPIRRRHILRNIALLWLDPNMNIDNDEYKYLLTQTSEIIDTIELHNDPDQCIDFCTDLQHTKVFIILPYPLAQQLIPLVHDIPQLYSIYVLCNDAIPPSQQLNDVTPKLKGYFRTIVHICQSINQKTKQYDHDSVPISVISPTDCSKYDLNELEPLFMYSRLLKQILFDIDRHLHTKERFVQFLREQYQAEPVQLSIVDEFEQNYKPDSAIRWYTRGCFLFQMLNQALRLMDSNIIIKMSFFLYDLHQQLNELYTFQSTVWSPGVLYRGQGVVKSEFENICKSVGGLLSFNAFTSTSVESETALTFCPIPPQDPDTIAVLFVMKINPSVKSTAFALVSSMSYYEDSEGEVLFSMHSVFRIESVEQVDDVLWRVKIVLTNDEDPDLKVLGEQIEEETQGSTGWSRLGQLLIQMGHFSEAKEVYLTLMDSLSNDNHEGLAYCYHQLGVISSGEAYYKAALDFYEKSTELYSRQFPENSVIRAAVQSNVGVVHFKMGEYSKALEIYENISQVYCDNLPANDPACATLYNNMGSLYEAMQINAKALEMYHKSLDVKKQISSPNHPGLTVIYRNIASVHDNLCEFSKALEFYEKTLEIQKKSLPPKHFELAKTYNNIATLYDKIGNYTQARDYYEMSLDIFLETHSEHHPSLANVYRNMAVVYDQTGDYSKALNFFEKALEIFEKSLPQDHPNFAHTYNNMGSAYDNIGEYTKALEHYQKAFEIYKRIRPQNHPDLAISLNNIGSMYDIMDDFPKALEHYCQALDIKEKSLPLHHPSLAIAYSNIGTIYEKTGNYSKALEYYEKSLHISEQSLPSNHPDLAVICSNLGQLYDQMEKYTESLDWYRKSLEIYQKSTTSDRMIELATLYNNIGAVYTHKHEFEKALEYHQKSFDIKQKLLKADHPSLVNTYNNIASVYQDMQEYGKAIEFYDKSVEIGRKILPENHSDLMATLNNMGSLYYEMQKFTEALPFYQEALDMAEKTLPTDHPDLQELKENVQVLKQYLKK
ncbi:unnamed protein product [Adineta ricciae]|uniref:Uncharacterized protein n=1 Tax=Adineta ricciae TaxID=249248 RepID=A0A815TKR4_ADIRI|nr:unnamed protein product [Adineta ricciae]